MHYNVQSLLNKLDIIEPELSNFDLVSLSETWLNERVLTQDLASNNNRLPFRRDRSGDSHGGIVVYVKENIPCKRRNDLELNTMECIWLELNIKYKNILVGTFYRPPNCTPLILADIENSIGLAIDTGIQDVVILGDFNLNFLNIQSKSKINNICRQFDLTQLITEPTNFAESSSTIIDLILVSNLGTVELSGVGESFLLQDIRYHCPTYCVLKFKKHLSKAFSRKIWLYEKGNYDAFRQTVSDYDWSTVIKEDVNSYANTLTQTLINLSEQYIPNKNVTIRPLD